MEVKDDFFTNCRKAVVDYAQERMLLIKLKTVDYSSRAVSLITVVSIGMLLFIVFLLMLGITGGFFFSRITGDTALGFGIMTLIFLVLIVLVVTILRKGIQSFVINTMIKRMFEKDNLKYKTETDGNDDHKERAGKN